VSGFTFTGIRGRFGRSDDGDPSGFREKRNTRGPILRSAAASAYTVYIIHPLFVVALCRALGDVPIPSLAKFALIAPVAVVLCFSSANVIRRAPLLRRIL
jgi:hypothetical protein